MIVAEFLCRSLRAKVANDCQGFADFYAAYDEGSDFEGIDRTVDSHMRNLRRKIEEDPRNPTYVQTVYGVGYRLGPVEEAS